MHGKELGCGFLDERGRHDFGEVGCARVPFVHFESTYTVRDAAPADPSFKREFESTGRRHRYLWVPGCPSRQELEGVWE